MAGTRSPERRRGAARSLVAALALLSGVLAAVAPGRGALAHEGSHDDADYAEFQLTARFLVTLEISALERGRAAPRRVLVKAPGAPEPRPPANDQGHPANRLVELYVRDIATGKTLTEAAPRVTITEAATGTSRELPAMAVMYRSELGPKDLHFGAHVYLPAGTFTIRVTHGGETATFEGIALEGRPAPRARHR